ncbi:hypothetical protein, partial [Neorhizobium galegae]|uniref:hypothetical protein n=1 Tax=Neorhizobium galegae TaxID=399 RepID=UPI0021080A02
LGKSAAKTEVTDSGKAAMMGINSISSSHFLSSPTTALLNATFANKRLTVQCRFGFNWCRK